MNTRTLVCSLALATTALAVQGQTAFTKITEGDIVNDLGGNFKRGAWGDFDNDGFLDLFVNDYGGTNVFYRNNRDGRFTKITQGDMVARADTCVSASWADYDNDGNFANFTNGGKFSLFHNDGAGGFTKAPAKAFPPDITTPWAALFSDYDNDGFADLLVINNDLAKPNRLYHNDRNGSFGRVLTNAIATDTWTGGGARNGGAWGDYDNDGLPDLFLTAGPGTENRLYRNDGNGAFTKITSASMLPHQAGVQSTGCDWGDYDNDGYLDLFVSSVHGRNQLFHNNSDGTFTEMLTGAPLTDGRTNTWYFGVSAVDYDNDGFLDLFIAGGETDQAPGKNALYRNDGNTNSWLEVNCVGTVSNRSAIGAKVRVRATIGGRTFWQMREVMPNIGYSSAPLVAHFGLGNATNVEVLRIEWPSGIVQEISGVAGRQILTVSEPSRLSATMKNGIPQISFKGGRGFQYQIEATTNLTTWSPVGISAITNLDGSTSVSDPNAAGARQRFYRAVLQPARIDPNFNPQISLTAQPQGVYVWTQPDGKIIVIDAPSGQATRLNKSGAPDDTFIAGESRAGIPNFRLASGLNLTWGNSLVNPLVPLASGQFLILNPYRNNNTGYGGLARLNSDGSLDSGFQPEIPTNWPVSSVAVQLDGTILVGRNLSDTPGTNLVGLNTDGTLDDAFIFHRGLGTDYCRRFLYNWGLLPDGKLIVHETGVPLVDSSCGYLSRYNPDGSLDSAFEPPNLPVSLNGPPATFQIGWPMIVDLRGRLVFFAWVDIHRVRMLRLNSDGSLDSSFAADFVGGLFSMSFPNALALEPDGNLIVAGNFTSVNGLPRPAIARVISEP